MRHYFCSRCTTLSFCVILSLRFMKLKVDRFKKKCGRGGGQEAGLNLHGKVYSKHQNKLWTHPTSTHLSDMLLMTYLILRSFQIVSRSVTIDALTFLFFFVLAFLHQKIVRKNLKFKPHRNDK